jgi:hypothetical protein
MGINKIALAIVPALASFQVVKIRTCDNTTPTAAGAHHHAGHVRVGVQILDAARHHVLADGQHLLRSAGLDAAQARTMCAACAGCDLIPGRD